MKLAVAVLFVTILKIVSSMESDGSEIKSIDSSRFGSSSNNAASTNEPAAKKCEHVTGEKEDMEKDGDHDDQTQTMTRLEKSEKRSSSLGSSSTAHAVHHPTQTGVPAWMSLEVDQLRLEEVNKLIEENTVVVFCKSWCPHCIKTKELLQGKQSQGLMSGSDYVTVELDLREDGDSMQRALYEISKQKTVPNIFIRKEHIGGNDNLHQLESEGKLDGKLKGTV